MSERAGLIEVAPLLASEVCRRVSGYDMYLVSGSHLQMLQAAARSSEFWEKRARERVEELAGRSGCGDCGETCSDCDCGARIPEGGVCPHPTHREAGVSVVHISTPSDRQHLHDEYIRQRDAAERGRSRLDSEGSPRCRNRSCSNREAEVDV